MRRYIVRGTVLLVVLTLLGLPWLATTAQPPQVRRIACLGFGPPPSASAPRPWVEEFRHALRQRGWIEDDNRAILCRWTEGGLDQFASLVAEVLGLGWISSLSRMRRRLESPGRQRARFPLL